MSKGISQDVPQIDFATLDLLPYGIIVVDMEGTILYYNAREEQIARRSREAVVGRNFFTDIAPCTQVREFHGRFRKAMGEEGGVAAFSFHFPFPDQPRDVEISLTRFEKDGEPLCLISVGDITERDAVRAEILRAERLREVGEVAAGVAHNFNNVLAVIRGNAELLRRTEQDEKGRRLIETILKASADGVQMVRRIQESTRQQVEPDASRALILVNEIVKDSLAFAEVYVREERARRGVEVAVQVELVDAPRPVLANGGALREVFINLLRNAVDAVEASGHITLRTRSEGSYEVAEVSDDGAGMSQETREKLFRPLFTTKGERGTGLGLATCYAIVRRHGGDIEVRSVQGAGTTFTVRLPRAPER